MSGSFHVSTADFLRFADGAKFFANLGQESVLTVAPPTAFGFLGNNPAPIAIQGSRLRVPEGKALSVAAGDVQMMGGMLQAESGRIQLASVAAPGEVIFSPLEMAPDLQVDSFARLGRLALSQGAIVTVSSSAGAGTVLLRSGRLLVDNAFIRANALGAGNSAPLGIDLRVAEDVVVTNGARVRANSDGAGHAGVVQVTAGSVQVKGGASIGSVASSTGNGGHVTVRAGRIELLDGGEVTIDISGPGNGGNLVVMADQVLLSGGFLFARQNSPSGTGHAGNVRVTTNGLQIVDGARIGAQTRGPGQGGNIDVRAERVFISCARNCDTGTGMFSNTFNTGRGGDGATDRRARGNDQSSRH